MAAGIAVKAVVVGLEAYGLYQQTFPELAVSKPESLEDLAVEMPSQPPGNGLERVRSFSYDLDPYCKHMAAQLGCRNTNIQLEARKSLDSFADHDCWVSYSKGIDLPFGKPVIVINPDMLPTAPLSQNGGYDPQLDKQFVCQFFITKSLAHLKQNTTLLLTVLRIVVFVSAVYFLSPAYPIASYAIGFVLEVTISAIATQIFNRRAFQMALKYTDPAAQRPVYDQLDLVRNKIVWRKLDLRPDRRIQDLIRSMQDQNFFDALCEWFKHSIKLISELSSLESQYPDLDLQISLLKEAHKQTIAASAAAKK